MSDYLSLLQPVACLLTISPQSTQSTSKQMHVFAQILLTLRELVRCLKVNCQLSVLTTKIYRDWNLHIQHSACDAIIYNIKRYFTSFYLIVILILLISH